MFEICLSASCTDATNFLCSPSHNTTRTKFLKWCDKRRAHSKLNQPAARRHLPPPTVAVDFLQNARSNTLSSSSAPSLLVLRHSIRALSACKDSTRCVPGRNGQQGLQHRRIPQNLSHLAAAGAARSVLSRVGALTTPVPVAEMQALECCT